MQYECSSGSSGIPAVQYSLQMLYRTSAQAASVELEPIVLPDWAVVRGAAISQLDETTILMNCGGEVLLRSYSLAPALVLVSMLTCQPENAQLYLLPVVAHE